MAKAFPFRAESNSSASLQVPNFKFSLQVEADVTVFPHFRKGQGCPWAGQSVARIYTVAIITASQKCTSLWVSNSGPGTTFCNWNFNISFGIIVYYKYRNDKSMIKFVLDQAINCWMLQQLTFEVNSFNKSQMYRYIKLSKG